MTLPLLAPLPQLTRQVIHRGYDRRSCWVHARCAFIPGKGDAPETAIVTLQKCVMGTSEAVWDLFDGIAIQRSDDGGRTWSLPEMQPAFRRWPEPGGVEVAVSDFTPQWHAATGKLLGLGHTCRYRNGALIPAAGRTRETAWSVFDPARNQWGPVQLLEMHDRQRFFSAGAGSIQWVERPDGELLVPIYFREAGEQLHPASRVLVMRCRFDGEQLTIQELGGELSVDAYRGLGEPSLTTWGGRYWLTLRNGERAYLADSEDGLHYCEPEPWRFDDGEELGSIDTQQHWARVGHRLFLVYTSRRDDNAHVVRYRAPLFMAEFDPERRVLIRESEQVAVPNRGGQLGNFGGTQRTAGEAWICASEWMENAGEWNPEVWNALKARFPGADLPRLAALPGRCGLCELGGADNSVHLVRATLPEKVEPGCGTAAE